MDAFTGEFIIKNPSMPTQLQSTQENLYFRWNTIFSPWLKVCFMFDKCSKHHSFLSKVKQKYELTVSKAQRARNVYQSKLINKSRDQEKFTVVLLTYKRKRSLTGLMKMMVPVKRVDKVGPFLYFTSLTTFVESVCIFSMS